MTDIEMHIRNMNGLLDWSKKNFPDVITQTIDAGLDALRRLQVIDKPCMFCETFDFATAAVHTSIKGSCISLAGGFTRFSKEERFKYCPVCGRRIKYEN